MKNYLVISLLACIVFSTNYCFGQTPINTVSTVSTIVVPGSTSAQTIRSHANSVNTVLPSTNYNLNYSNNGNVNIISFSLSGKTYVRFKNFDTVILRRAANAWETTGGNKQHIYVEGAAAVNNVTFNMPFPTAFPQVSGYAYMQKVMKEGYINRGSDNVFNNDSASDLTYNNIERVDFVYKPGMTASNIASAGFLIAERGGNDAFKIAAITGIDVNGNPTSFGPVRSVGTASYGGIIMSAATYVMRKDPADNNLRPFSLVPSQGIRSVFIRLGDLGIASLQRVYGYALMGNDVTASTSAQVLNYTNTTYFPRTTTTVNGGMDLASAPGIFETDFVLAGHYLTLTVQNKSCRQELDWNDNDFMQAKAYQVERSMDGNNFEPLKTVSAIQDSKNVFIDNSASGPCYYRIKVIQHSGEEYYSSVVFANNSCSGTKVSLYPNPAKDIVTLNFDAAQRIQQVSVVSLSGKEIGNWKVNENSQQLKLDISALPQGQYFVRLSDANGNQKAYPVIKL